MYCCGRHPAQLPPLSLLPSLTLSLSVLCVRVFFSSFCFPPISSTHSPFPATLLCMCACMCVCVRVCVCLCGRLGYALFDFGLFGEASWQRGWGNAFSMQWLAVDRCQLGVGFLSICACYTCLYARLCVCVSGSCIRNACHLMWL